jgi:hypothetical protein
MSKPADTDGRLWVLLLVACAVSGTVGAFLGHLLGLGPGVGIAALMLVSAFSLSRYLRRRP